MRNEANACIFTGSRFKATSTLSHAQVNDMQNRIDRLENLVTSLVSEGKDGLRSSPEPVTSQEDDISRLSNVSQPSTASAEIDGSKKVKKGLGMLEVNDNHSLYFPTTHWRDVLLEARNYVVNYLKFC